MTATLKHLLFILLLLCSIAIPAVQAQTTAKPDTTITIFTADSLKSGNYKDVFTSFFQLALQNLSGPNKEFRFNSNPFAVMLRSDRTLAIDTNWIRYRHLRDLNFSVALKADSDFHFNGFSGGVKYALINKRDVTISKAFFYNMANSPEGMRWETLNVQLDRVVNTWNGDAEAKKKLRDERDKLTGIDKFSYNDLPDDIKKIISGAAESRHYKELQDAIRLYPDISWNSAYSTDYNSAKEAFLKQPLWTIGVDGTTYSNKFAFSNFLVGSEFLLGILNKSRKTKSYEFDLKAQFSLSDDSLKADRDLDRQIFSFEPGVNISFRNKQNKKSYFEFKLSGSYYHNFSGLRNAEKADSSTINAEARLRVYDDIWIPVVVKYDPRNKNLFGFLNISANFTALGNLLGKKQNQ